MNIKNLTTYEGGKLGHDLDSGQYVVITKDHTIKFDSFEDGRKCFQLFCDLNKPSVMTRIVRKIKGREYI